MKFFPIVFYLVEPEEIDLEGSVKFRFSVYHVQLHNSKKSVTYYSAKILPRCRQLCELLQFLGILSMNKDYHYYYYNKLS